MLILILNSSKLNACSCSLASFENAVEYSDEIFIGKVIKVELYDDYRRKYQIEVEKKWKGNNDSILIFHSGWTSCDVSFDVGKRYLVYAERYTTTDGNSDNLSTWWCSRTTHEPTKTSERGNWYEEDLKRLDEKFRYQQRLLQGVNKKNLNEPDKTNPNKLTIIEEQPNSVYVIQKKSNNYYLIIGGISFSMILILLVRRRKKN